MEVVPSIPLVGCWSRPPKIDVDWGFSLNTIPQTHRLWGKLVISSRSRKTSEWKLEEPTVTNQDGKEAEITHLWSQSNRDGNTLARLASKYRVGLHQRNRQFQIRVKRERGGESWTENSEMAGSTTECYQFRNERKRTAINQMQL